MHIVQLLPELNQGGVERSVVEFNRELVHRGHRSTVISAGGTQADRIETDGGRHISFDICTKNPLTIRRRVNALRSILKDLSPDIVHAHSRIPAWLCRFANSTLRIPFVTTVHGFNHISAYSRIMTRGDAVICVSNPLKRYLEQHYRVNGPNLAVIPGGVDLAHFNPDGVDQNWIDAFKQEFGLDGKYVVTNVGRITPLKDHDTFIRAIAACREKIPHIRGVIVGGVRHNKQALYQHIRQLTCELGVENEIVFTGAQTHLPEIYSLSDILVSSSKKPESFGLTLIEALSMNTPIIAPRHGGVLDIIKEGQNGWLFEPEHVDELAHRVKTIHTQPLGELRSQTIRNFSLTQMVDSTISVYEKLLNSLHIVQVLPELNQGGVERGTIELNRELVKRGHRSTVISAGGSQTAQIELDGGHHIQLNVCSKNPFTFFQRMHALRRTLQMASPAPDILHARSRVPAWLCHYANKPLRIPFITTVHGFNSVNKYSEIMTRGDRVIYGSAAIKTYILNNYSVDESLLRYVPRGIDMDLFDPQKADIDFIREFENEHALKGKTVITIVGRITEWKGHDTFIRALAAVQKKHPDIVGVVAGGIWHGKDDYFNTLKKLASELHAEIRFVGSQTRVREIYALSDLVVSAASTKAETFGRTAAEALAMNTPVIASAHGGSLDILLDETNGFLFPPNDAAILAEKIDRALHFPFTHMRTHIEKNFSLHRMTEDELAVYRELL